MSTRNEFINVGMKEFRVPKEKKLKKKCVGLYIRITFMMQSSFSFGVFIR